MLGPVSALINDPLFKQLEADLRRPNVFEVLGVAQHEIRHSRMLAWLLDAMGQHGLKEGFLKRFLDDLVSATGTDLAYPMDWGQIRIRREWQHIDLLIEAPEFIVLIENKTRTRDHSDQLSRYLQRVKQRFPGRTLLAVYLTPEGESPRERAPEYTPYSYAAVSAHLAELLVEQAATLTARQRIYLEDYLLVLKRHLMSEDERAAWVAQLFHDHGEALNFLLENRPNPKAEIKQLLENIVQENHWHLGSPGDDFVRFLTPEASDHTLQYQGNHPWANKESMLFEILIDLPTPDTINLKFRVVVSPVSAPGEKEIRSRLVALLNSVAKPANRNSEWHHYLTTSVSIQGWSAMPMEQRRRELNPFIAELSSAVQRVDTLLSGG